MAGARGGARPNVTLKLMRPASARQPSCLRRRQRDGVTAVAVRDSVLRTSFAATAAPRTFHAFGSGTLAVYGEVIVTSRIAGQQVLPELNVTRREGAPLLVATYPEEGSRANFGLSEVGGGIGVVRVAGEGWEQSVTILPWSHVQFPVPPGLIETRVLTGTATVTAYVSQIDPTGDAMFLAAENASEARRRCAPAITSQTSGTPEWRSDAWFASRTAGTLHVESFPGGAVDAAIPSAYEDVLARLFHRTVTTSALCTTLPPDVFGSTRIVHGSTTQAVPFLPIVPAVQHLLFIENNDTDRTNIGIVSEAPASVDAIVYDASGVELERHRLSTEGGVVQIPVTALVTNGRATIQPVTGTARAYASVIHRPTGDATFFPSQ